MDGGFSSSCLYLWDSPTLPSDCTSARTGRRTFLGTSRLNVWRFIEVHDDVVSASDPMHAGAGWETVSSC
jgi:hypothetical protein